MKEQLFRTYETKEDVEEMLNNGWTISHMFIYDNNHYKVVYEAENPKEFEYKVVTNFADLESLGTEGFELCEIDKSDNTTKYIFRKEKL